MVQDGKRSPTSTLDDLDLPPAYDLATATAAPAFQASGSSSAGILSTPAAGSSSSWSSTHPPAAATASGPRQPPRNLAHLFSEPVNAEPLLGRPTTPAATLEGIQTYNKFGTIFSLDPLLSDPDVLYDFIRMQALCPPKIKLRCIGAHTEIPDRDETIRDADGILRIKRKGQPERIVDFDFSIDLSDILDHPANKANIHLATVPASTPIHRGTNRPTFGATYAPAPRHHDGYTSLGDSDGEVSVTDVGRSATRRETAKMNEWLKWKEAKGLPRWAEQRDCPEFLQRSRSSSSARSHAASAIRLEDSGNSSVDVDVEPARSMNEGPALKAWCSKYCADKGLLKEFYLLKSIWGWDRDAVLGAVQGAILSTGYISNDLTVSFEQNDLAVCVRPANLLWRLLGQTWIYVLLWVTLVYPLIWIWRRVHPRGGGPYNAARASYGMKYYPPLPTTFPAETIEAAQSRLPGMYKIHPELPHPTHLQPGPRGIHYLLGRKEGEWFREWEERIRMAVRMRYKGVLEGGGSEDDSGRQLDGYER